MTDADQKRLVAKVSEEVSHGDFTFFSGLSESEKALALSLLADTDTSKALHSALWEIDYARKPVDVSTFLLGKDYLGLNIIRSAEDEAFSSGIFEVWAQTLVELFRPDKSYWELILSSSIGTGKTSVAVYALAYKLYRLSCLKNPQKFYGLLPGHAIVLGVYNIFKYKAQSVAASYLREAVTRCPYFKDVFPLNANKTVDLEFPNSIRIGYGATALHSIGENLFSVLIDETEFMKAASSQEEQGQAWKLYNSTLRRMESRYMRGGDIPGLMIQISSKASADSYLAERIKSRGAADDVLIVEKTGWEVKPWRYTGKTFPLFIGDSQSDPRILQESEVSSVKDPTRLMRVPEEHRLAFSEDIYGALRDLANVASGAANPLIPKREKIFEAIDSSRKHPFSKLEFHIGLDDDTAIEDYLDVDALLQVRASKFSPRVNPTTPRYIHLDLAVSGDACGFCMGHVPEFDVTRKEDVNTPGHVFDIKRPKVYVDILLRVVPAKGSKIRLSAIKDFIFALRAYGFIIAEVSADTYQSTDLLQQLERSGIKTRTLSVDVATEKEGHPYAFVREGLMEGRISYYHYPQLLIELANLQRFDVVSGGKIKWKVDHPQKMMNLQGDPVKGAKDVADALTGVVKQCAMQDPDVDPPALTPVQALIKTAVNPTSRLTQNDWVIGNDYRP